MRIALNLFIFFALLCLQITPALAGDFLDSQIIYLPSDTELTKQTYLDTIKAIEGWNIIHDSPNVTVAIIDTGVDINHPDLYKNIWLNEDEIKGDHIDNDHNGYIDDVNGWDFVLNSPDPEPKFGGQNTKLGISHGTIIAGVLGAMGNNNFGLAGISWNIKIMPLKVMDGEGNGKFELLKQAIRYAIDNGADIINLSLVSRYYDQQLEDLIKEAFDKNIVIVAAAGNETIPEGLNIDVGLNLDLIPHYPICNDGQANYVLGVGSVNNKDIKSKFSNYGTKCIDIYAPGESFYGLNPFAPAYDDYRKYLWLSAFYNLPGGHTGGATPVPIPNTAVKPFKADGTSSARLWESR